MKKKLFITGTDTDCGKTWVTTQLLNLLTIKTQWVGVKAIASGANIIDGELKNNDALTLQQASTPILTYQQTNPICYEPAIAPHIAADITKKPIHLNAIEQVLTQLEESAVDGYLIEGAGGWALPINYQQLLSDWVITQKIPILLVVGMKLGCLNHAILTAKVIAQEGGQLIGWIANQIQPDFNYLAENIYTLQQQLAAPCLGITYHNQQPSGYIIKNKAYIDTKQLLTRMSIL